MKLSKKDLETLQSLIKIEKVILKRYKQATKEEDKAGIASRILPLIYMENDLLTSLDITEEKLKELEKYYQSKVGINIESKLLLGTQASLTDDNYAYYRIIARLRSIVLKTHSQNYKYAISLLDDYEVALLYRSLLEELKKDKSLKDGLENYAYMILMDSPEMEIKILENGLAPLNGICDTVDIITDYMAFEALKKVQSEFGTCNLICEYRSSDSVRQSRFREKSKEIFASLVRFQQIYRGDLMKSSISLMLLTYLKTIITFQDKKRRIVLYEQLLSDEDLKDSKIAGIEDFIKTSIEDIEKNMVPYIENVSLVPTMN